MIRVHSSQGVLWFTVEISFFFPLADSSHIYVMDQSENRSHRQGQALPACFYSGWPPLQPLQLAAPPPPSDDQLGPAGLSPLLPMKRIISNLRTCATLGLAVDLQTRQVPPPSPPLLPQHLAVPQLSARPVQGFYFYFIPAKWKHAFFPFLNCPLSVDLGRLAISITLTAAAAAALSSPGKPSKVFTRWHSPSRVI